MDIYCHCYIYFEIFYTNAGDICPNGLQNAVLQQHKKALSNLLKQLKIKRFNSFHLNTYEKDD